MSKVIFLNAFSNYARLILSVIVALILSPFLVHQLGDFHYGIWAIIMAVVGYFSLMDFGMNRAIVRYVSKYDAEGRSEKLNEFINTCLGLFSGAGIIIVLATVLVSVFLDKIVDLQDYVFLGKVTVLICGIDFAFAFPFGVLYAIFIAKQKHTLANKIGIVVLLGRSVVIYLVLLEYQSLLVLALIQVVFNLAKNIWILLEVRKLCPELKFGFRYFSKELISKILNYSIYSFAISVSGRVINFTDEIVVAHYLKVSDVTFYAIAVNLIGYFEKLVWTGASVLVPYISQLDSTQNNDQVEKSFFVGSKYTMLFSFFIFCGLTIFGEDFINIWMGPKYGSTVFSIMFILAFSKVIVVGQSMTNARFFGTSDHQALGKLNAVEAVVNLLLSIILVQRMGMIGVALGTLIPCVIFNGILLPIISFRKFEISFMEFTTKIVNRPLLVALLSYFLYENFILLSTGSYLELFLAVISFSALYCIITVLFIVDKKLFIRRMEQWIKK